MAWSNPILSLLRVEIPIELQGDVAGDMLDSPRRKTSRKESTGMPTSLNNPIFGINGTTHGSILGRIGSPSLFLSLLLLLSLLCLSLCTCSRSVKLQVSFPDAVHYFNDKFGVDLTRSRNAIVYMDPARSETWKGLCNVFGDMAANDQDNAAVLPLWIMVEILRSDKDGLTIRVKDYEKDNRLNFDTGNFVHYALRKTGSAQVTLRVRCARDLLAFKGGYFDFTASRERDVLAMVQEEIRTSRYQAAFTRSRLKKNIGGAVSIIKTLHK